MKIKRSSKLVVLILMLTVLISLLVLPAPVKAKSVIITMGGNWVPGVFGKTCRCPVSSNADCECEFVFNQ
jgi:hypothetical protein